MGRSRMFGDGQPERIDSPRTTIVGGRPPAGEVKVPGVPIGLEKLLRLAAEDEAFRGVLLKQRSGAAEAAEVSLTATERAILDAIPSEQLEAMAASVTGPPVPRRRFLTGAAASAAVALGGAALASCGSPAGVQPDMPPPVMGATADLPEERVAADGGSEAGPAADPEDEERERPDHNEMQSDGGISPH